MIVTVHELYIYIFDQAVFTFLSRSTSPCDSSTLPVATYETLHVRKILFTHE